jgi:hypothetical protein
MDNSQKKIIPGCEKLTKPEEISALKDYLKQGIQENEDSLVLGEDSPSLNASEDPSVKNLSIDQNKKVLLHTDKKGIDLENKVYLELSGDKVKIPGEESRVLLNIDEEKIELKNQPKDRIEIFNSNKNPKIEEYREQLSVLSDKSSLSNFFSPLTVDNQVEIKKDTILCYDDGIITYNSTNLVFSDKFNYSKAL